MVTSMAFLAWWWQTKKQPSDLSASLLLTITNGKAVFCKKWTFKESCLFNNECKGKHIYSDIMTHFHVLFQISSILGIFIFSAIMLDRKGAYLWLQFCHIFDPLIPLLTLCPLPSHHFGMLCQQPNSHFCKHDQMILNIFWSENQNSRMTDFQEFVF